MCSAALSLIVMAGVTIFKANCLQIALCIPSIKPENLSWFCEGNPSLLLCGFLRFDDWSGSSVMCVANSTLLLNYFPLIAACVKDQIINGLHFLSKVGSWGSRKSQLFRFSNTNAVTCMVCTFAGTWWCLQSAPDELSFWVAAEIGRIAGRR